jgi:hypothetical protein
LKTESAPASEADPLSISVEGRGKKLPEVPAPVVGTEVQVVVYEYCKCNMDVLVSSMPLRHMIFHT